MLHITDERIDRHVTAQDAQQAMLAAFQSFGRGAAAMQERIRTEAGGVKLSTLGAVIPEQEVAGAKGIRRSQDSSHLSSCCFQRLTAARWLRSMRARSRGCARRPARCWPRSGWPGLRAPRSRCSAPARRALQHARNCPPRCRCAALVVDPYADAGLPDRLAAQWRHPRVTPAGRAASPRADIIVTASRSTTLAVLGRADPAGHLYRRHRLQPAPHPRTRRHRPGPRRHRGGGVAPAVAARGGRPGCWPTRRCCPTARSWNWPMSCWASQCAVMPTTS